MGRAHAKKLVAAWPHTEEHVLELLLLCEAMMGFKEALSRYDDVDARYCDELLQFRRTIFEDLGYEDFKKEVMNQRRTAGAWT